MKKYTNRHRFRAADKEQGAIQGGNLHGQFLALTLYEYVQQLNTTKMRRDMCKRRTKGRIRNNLVKSRDKKLSLRSGAGYRNLSTPTDSDGHFVVVEK